MDYEHISEDMLTELENASVAPITAEEKHYIELNKTMNNIENQLTQIIEIVCELVSKIGNIITKLNYIETSVILK